MKEITREEYLALDDLTQELYRKVWQEYIVEYCIWRDIIQINRDKYKDFQDMKDWNPGIDFRCIYREIASPIQKGEEEPRKPEYFEKYDYPFNSIHRKLNEFVNNYGWKELFFIILKFQSEKAGDNPYKLISSVSDDYKRLVTKYCSPNQESLQSIIAAKDKEIADLKKRLKNGNTI